MEPVEIARIGLATTGASSMLLPAVRDRPRIGQLGERWEPYAEFSEAQGRALEHSVDRARTIDRASTRQIGHERSLDQEDESLTICQRCAHACSAQRRCRADEGEPPGDDLD